MNKTSITITADSISITVESEGTRKDITMSPSGEIKTASNERKTTPAAPDPEQKAKSKEQEKGGLSVESIMKTAQKYVDSKQHQNALDFLLMHQKSHPKSTEIKGSIKALTDFVKNQPKAKSTTTPQQEESAPEWIDEANEDPDGVGSVTDETSEEDEYSDGNPFK